MKFFILSVVFSVVSLSAFARVPTRLESLKCQARNLLGTAEMTYIPATDTVHSVVNGGAMNIDYTLLWAHPTEATFSQSDNASTVVMVQKNDPVKNRIYAFEFSTAITPKTVQEVSGNLVSYIVVGSGSFWNGTITPVSMLPIATVNCSVKMNW